MLQREWHFFALHCITLSSDILCLFSFYCCVELFYVKSSHQVGEDVVVSSAVFSRGHHLQVAGGDTHTVSHILYTSNNTKNI